MNTDLLLVLDLGGEQAYYTARKLRGEQFHCELFPADTPVEVLRAREPMGVLLAGGKAEGAALSFDPALLGVPVLALGDAARILALAVGAQDTGTQLEHSMDNVSFDASPLFESLTQCDRFFDRVDGFALPEGFETIAQTQSGASPAFACPAKRLFGVQFCVESNDPEGLTILENFAEHICGCPRSWQVESFAPQLIEDIRAEVGERSMLLPVSSGLENAVTAALLQRAIGSRLQCLFIDTGLMRMGEPELVRKCFREHLDLELIEVNAAERFMKALHGVSAPDAKRNAVHDEYATILAEQYIKAGSVECIAEVTTYSDLLKGHKRAVSNVIDGCTTIEPLKWLFKDDVRMLGHWLGLPEEMLSQPSFEFCGLSVRCLGEVTPERLRLLRGADAIFMQEVERAGLAHRIAQYFAILTDIRTPGRNGRGYVCALRALGTSNAGRAAAYKLPYDLMEAVVERITGEIPQITHVVYDITGRPIAAVEWE